ncbi:MAG: HAD family phosphatase [Nanoarchaeota archaeon]
MLEKLNLKKYFQIVVDESQIAKAKPNPEIYQKAAKKIGFPAKRCIVIEDAVLGIEAATRAGMRVIAITTTQKRSELSQADVVIDCFRELSYKTLAELINKTT